MKNKARLTTSFIIIFYVLFFTAIYALEYFGIAPYRKEIAILTGLIPTILAFSSQKRRDDLSRPEKHPIMFWLSIFLTLSFSFSICSELMKG